ncbi:Detected protein of confused Function [Hibiscus syriacus]|uniref:Detected protein of confused Function n=1 Tax=Hibiscus syriacus TaxID=106335 RepID=A0A6A2YP03_HIBSY|nr:Detected protein of confused Function [Hibiscus syriacus]
MVILVEIIGGVKAHSLAVLTDAAHLLTDVAGFSYLFSRSGLQHGRQHHTIPLDSVVLKLLHDRKEINGALMFAVAAFGFVINSMLVLWLGHDHNHHVLGDNHHHHEHHHHQHHHEHHHHHYSSKPCDLDEEDETSLVLSSTKKKILNINLQGAYLHVMTDLIQSVGVMIAAAVIWLKPKWTPRDINIEILESGIKGINGVEDIHDLHVWAITVGKLVLSCHVVAKPGVESKEIISKIRDFCEKTYKIHHITVQIEQL